MALTLADSLFGRTLDCECGRSHTIAPDRIVYADDALASLPALAAAHTKGRRVLVLMDARTRSVAGDAAVAALAEGGWQVAAGEIPDGPDGGSPVCDGPTRAALTGQAAAVDLLVAVGSGTVCDLAKWLAFDEGRTYLCVPTAASMNGYASANVAPLLDGVKSLLRAHPPAAIAAVPAVLRDAPYEMTAAGLGDVLAKSTGSADWLVNHLLFADYYCPRSVALIETLEPLYLNQPRAIAERDPAAMAALFEALLLTGAAMTMAGTSAPASGGEHLISHGLDMLASRDGRPHDLHGRQVGVGTILAAELYHRLLAIETPSIVRPPTKINAAYWGKLSPVVATQYAEKQPRLAQAAAKLAEPACWDRLRAAVAPILRPPQVIADCLAQAGAACRSEDIGCDRQRLYGLLINAGQMRSRFTILDLAALVGLLPADADAVLDAWA